MAKFTLTFSEAQDDYNEVIVAVAKQNNLDVDKVVGLVHRFTDGDSVTLQFDTEKKKCWVVYTNKEGVNDFKDEVDVVIKATNVRDKYTEGRKAYMASLERQLDEALETYKAEDDKHSAAAKNLLRFIEDTRQELNRFREADRNREKLEAKAIRHFSTKAVL